MKGAHGVLITTHMRLWQKRSRLCHFLELRSGMRIDSLGCTWWVLSSKWSKSSQLAVATEPLVPLIRLGLYVLDRCSTWGCLFSRRRIFSVALPPQDAPRHRRRPTTASRHQRRTYTRFAPSAADLVRRFLSAADLVAQTEQHGQRPLAATTSTARGYELAGADSHMACAPNPMGGDPQPAGRRRDPTGATSKHNLRQREREKDLLSSEGHQIGRNRAGYAVSVFAFARAVMRAQPE